MTMTKAKKPAIQAASVPPEWLTETPEECGYYLEMYEGGGASIQEVSITRDEYIALKQHLARMRGHRTSRRRAA